MGAKDRIHKIIYGYHSCNTAWALLSYMGAVVIDMPISFVQTPGLFPLQLTHWCAASLGHMP